MWESWYLLKTQLIPRKHKKHSYLGAHEPPRAQGSTMSNVVWLCGFFPPCSKAYCVHYWSEKFHSFIRFPQVYNLRRVKNCSWCGTAGFQDACGWHTAEPSSSPLRTESLTQALAHPMALLLVVGLRSSAWVLQARCSRPSRRFCSFSARLLVVLPIQPFWGWERGDESNG